MNKSIAIICDYTIFPERIGGMDRFFVKFDKILKENDYNVDWFFTNYQPFDFYKDLTIYSANSVSVEQSFLNISKGNKKEYSTIITHFTELCTSYYKEFKKRYPKSYIIAVDHNPRPTGGYKFNKRLKKKIKGILYSNYINKFIAVSHYSKKNIIKDFGKFTINKIVIINNGIETELFIKKKKYKINDKLNIIIACHLRESKGVQDLLYALDMLTDSKKSKLKIDIYGDGPYGVELKKITSKLNLDNFVNFKGSTDKLNEIYCKYDFLIHPSHGETYCYSVVESLISNLPVITTKNEGNILKEVEVYKNGFLYNSKDIDGLYRILNEIIIGPYDFSIDSFGSLQNKYSIHKMVNEHFNLIPCT